MNRKTDKKSLESHHPPGLNHLIGGVAAKWIRSCLIVLCLFHSISSAGQSTYVEKTDSLLGNYAAQFSNTKLHLHVDKSIYTPNETVWFSAYLYSLAADTFPHQLLYVKLLRHDNDSLIRSAIFPIVEDHSFGQFLLPASIPVGTYKLLAYTDALADGMPAVSFRQQLQIKTDAQPAFAFQLRLLDSISAGKDSFRVLLKGTEETGRPIQNATVQYELSADGRSIQKSKTTLNEKGEVSLLLPRVRQKNLFFKSQVTIDGKKQSFSLPVQQPIEPPQVRFYPEGGNILANRPAHVPVEVIGAGGLPIRCTVKLFENEQLLQSKETNTHGIASFRFTPKLNAAYEARISVDTNVHSYDLPAVKASGYSLHTREGVIEDSIRVVFQKSGGSGRNKLIIHNFKQVFWAADINSEKDQLEFSISADLFPTGLYALTLTNERSQPLSERLVFVDRDRTGITVKTDKARYAPRESVALDLKVDSLRKNPVQKLSVSCVAISRLDFETYADMLTTIFLKDELADFSGSALYFFRGQKERLNDILLTRGWRQYHWRDVTTDSRMARSLSTLHPTKGRVTMKKQDGPFEIALFSDRQIIPYRTDSAGNFTLALADLVTPMEKPLFLAPVKNSKKEKQLILMDTIFKLLDNRANSLPLSIKESGKRFISFSHQDVVPLPPDAKAMAVVVIAAKSKTTRFVSKTCQDWVCQYNILNCSNHPYGGVPIDGERYLYRENRGAATQEVIYVGCESVVMATPKEFVSLPRISIGKQFYKPIYDAAQTTPPEYLTTLYWNPLLKMENNRFRDSFYTSDTKDIFFLVVNGLVDGMPVQAVHQFEVK